MATYKGVELPIEARGKKKLFGFMFQPSKTTPLLFRFSDERARYVHSFFVFFPFIAVMMDKNNKVVDNRIFKPFEIYRPKKRFTLLLEVPLM